MIPARKPSESFSSKPSIFRRKLHKTITFIFYRDAPENNSHRDMYITLSSDHTSFNFNMPFKLILRRCEVVF